VTNARLRLTRRTLLKGLAGAAVASPLAHPLGAIAAAPSKPASPFSPEDDLFLDDIERASCCFFWEQANPQNGLVKDRCNARRAATDNSSVASIAATGFGLTALCIADHRGFLSRSEARQRVITTLQFLSSKLPNHRGFFYHWADINTGERVWDSEVSSIDTAILLCGMRKM